MKTILGLTILLLANWPGVLVARLGETPAECAKRYGKMVREDARDGMKVQVFTKSGFTVRVSFQ